MSELKISIDKKFPSRVTEIFAWRAFDDGSFEEYTFVDGRLTAEKIARENASQAPKPLFNMEGFFAEELLTAISAEMSKKGFRSEEEYKIEGKLNAKEVHLADFRNITNGLLAILNK